MKNFNIRIKDIRDAKPCSSGWRKFALTLNKYQKITTIKEILESNNISGTLWVVGNVLKDVYALQFLAKEFANSIFHTGSTYAENAADYADDAAIAASSAADYADCYNTYAAKAADYADDAVNTTNCTKHYIAAVAASSTADQAAASCATSAINAARYAADAAANATYYSAYAAEREKQKQIILNYFK